MLVLRRPATLELLTFSTMIKTGRRAVGNSAAALRPAAGQQPRRLPGRAAEAERLPGQPVWLGAYAAASSSVGVAAGHLGRRAGHVARRSELNDEIPF